MLKTLCDLNGTSGNEAAVRDYILEQIRPYCTTCSVDAMGSVIAFKKGKRTPEKRVMLSAHMDEVGFIITGATEEGYLQFAPVGGINPSVVLGRHLALENGGFGMVIDGSEDSARHIKEMLLWDVNNGIARRSWARNEGAMFAIKREMERTPGLKVTLPNLADDKLVRKAIDEVK